MLKNFTYSIVGATLLAATGCAGSYSTIRPEHIPTYQSTNVANAPVDFSYQYSALLLHGANKKYVKKERKRGYQTVAVRIKNNTATELNFSRDLELYFGDRPIIPVPAVQAAHDLKQGVLIYLLYTPLMGTVGGQVDPYTGQTTGGTLIPWGPFVAAGNMIGAGTANTNLRKEFMRYEMTNKVLRPGETVYGIISLREMNVAPLRLVLRNAAVATTPQPQFQPSSVPASQASPAQALPVPTATPR